MLRRAREAILQNIMIKNSNVCQNFVPLSPNYFNKSKKKMEREVLMEKTIRKIEQLPTSRVREVNDFVEFVIRRTDDALITEGLQHLSSYSHVNDFLINEPELYSVNDLKVQFK